MSRRGNLFSFFVAATTGVVSGVYIFQPLIKAASGTGTPPPSGLPIHDSGTTLDSASQVSMEGPHPTISSSGSVSPPGAN